VFKIILENYFTNKLKPDSGLYTRPKRLEYVSPESTQVTLAIPQATDCEFDPVYIFTWPFGESRDLKCFIYCILPNSLSEWKTSACPE
jgi:hypothetical protein